MSRYKWKTPEEVARLKKRNKILLYISMPVATVVLTALVTILLN